MSFSHLDSQFIQQNQMDFLEDMHSFGHSFAGCLQDKLIDERMKAPKGKIERAVIMHHMLPLQYH